MNDENKLITPNQIVYLMTMYGLNIARLGKNERVITMLEIHETSKWGKLNDYERDEICRWNIEQHSIAYQPGEIMRFIYSGVL